MARFSVCQKTGLRRGAWTPEEDKLLVAFIARHGHSNWRLLPKHAGLARDGKSCRLRWMNYLRPDLKRGCFTAEEDEIIISMLQKHGNRWSVIAQNLPGRTDNEIKNHWRTHLKKRNVTVEETKLRSVDESGILTPLYTGSNPLSPLDFSWLFEMINPNTQVVEKEVILNLDGEFEEKILPQESAVVVDHSSGEFFIPQLEEAFSPYKYATIMR